MDDMQTVGNGDNTDNRDSVRPNETVAESTTLDEQGWTDKGNAAAQAGLNEAIIKSIAAGKRPESMDADETIIYNFGTELLTTHQVSDANFKAVKDKFGERGVVDLISVMGYYQLVSMLLNVDRYPLPAGVKPELQPLK